MKKPLRVLMVEDSEDDALLEIRALKNGGYDPEYERVETAGAMRTALREKTWDIIVCDYKMPKFNGLAAIALLKETGIDIPIIIVSGAIGEETAADCMRYGANDYVMKGNLSRLVPAIERELKDAESRRKRKLAEEALRESEERFKNLYQESPIPTFTWQKKGDNFILVDFNRAAIQITNGKVRDRLGNSAVELYKNSPQILRDMNLCFQERSIVRRELTSRHFAPGRFLSVHYGFISPDLIIVHTEDQTTRKHAEELLRRTEENFRRSLDDSPLGVRIVTIEGETIYANRAILDIYGYDSIEELKTTSAEKRYTPESHAEFQIRREKRKRGDDVPSEYDISIVRKDGEVRHLHVFRKDILWDGKRQHQVLCNDISERRRAEEALRESEILFRSYLENAPDGVYMNDLEGNFLYGNSKCEEIIGYRREELIGKNFLELNLLQEKSLNTAAQLLQANMEGRSTGPDEVVLIRKDGRLIPVEINTNVVQRMGQRIVLSFVRDITERRRTAEELQQTFERLRKAINTTIQVMVSAVEIRDPCTSGHQVRSANLARTIATEMGLPPKIIDGLRMAGSIHDIGKLSVPAEILSKPTKLTAIEFSLIKEHSRNGYEMLKDVESPWPLAEIVYQHHERMDGSGYPRNLKGEEILMEARIMAVADVVESMASHRPYRPALGIDAALNEIEKNRGTHYDNTVADACLKLFREKGFILERA